MQGSWVRGLTAVIASAAVIGSTETAGAATINVTTSDDVLAAGGTCSLREAIDSAVDNNANGNGCTSGEAGPTRDTIVLSGANPYNLTIPSTDDFGNANGDLDVGAGGPITIRGAGQFISTGQSDRVFELIGPADLTLENVHVGGGDATGLVNDDGGNIRVANDGASLTLRDVELTGGEAELGGGIRIQGNASTLSLVDSEIAGNEAALAGGGVSIGGTSNATITGSEIAFNEAASANAGGFVEGGGIAHAGGELTVSDSVVSDNLAENTSGDPSSSAFGGGIASHDPFTVRRSLIRGNTATAGEAASAEYGGGIALQGTGFSDEFMVVNTTITGNTAGDNIGRGAGIGTLDAQGTLDIDHVTFTANSASEAAAGDHVDLAGAGILNAELGRSILTSGLFTNPCEDAGGHDVFSTGYNVATSADPDCSFGPNDLAGGGVSLGFAGSVQDNGGPTPTIALTASSDAIDFVPAGPCGVAGGTDQRGVQRPAGGGCEAGAYERATCAGKLVDEDTILGTAASETLTGTAGADVIYAQGGNDRMLGLGGNDTLCGGAGNDVGKGGAGKDLILGERGNDRLAGGNGADRLVGGPGRDRLRGGRGRDVLLGGPGRDKLRGGPGRDKLRGGPGKDDEKQ